MGSLLSIYCPDCKKSFDYTVGIGRLPLNGFFFDGLSEDSEIIEQFKKENIEFPSSKDELIKCEHKLYFCRKCHQLGEYNYFKLLKAPSFIPKRKCPECNTRMRGISNLSEILTEQIKVCCPECKKEINSDSPGTDILLGCWD